jgi:ADP-heptose:LPS heptosyltransferase
MLRRYSLAEKFFRLRFGRRYLVRADRARQKTDWPDAIYCYRRALDWLPWREDLKIQIGKAYLEYGDTGTAIEVLQSVAAENFRAEAAWKIAEANRRAGFPQSFVASGDAGQDGRDRLVEPVDDRHLPNRIKIDTTNPRRWLGPLGRARMAARHAPPRNGIMLDQLGTMRLERDGIVEPLLAGIFAIRGRFASMQVSEPVEVWLGEGKGAKVIARSQTTSAAAADSGTRTQLFNLWLDAGLLPEGRHRLTVKAPTKRQDIGVHVNVTHRVAPQALQGSDAYVASPSEPVSCEDYIAQTPATVRSGARALFTRPPRTILVIRADQLGDVSASLAAMQRLRALFPGACLTALVQPSTAAIVDASTLADEVLSVTLPYDRLSERRRLDQEEEDRLRGLLADRRFDFAIDLSPGDETRPLLLLAHADILVGFDPDRFPYLDFGITTRSRDKVHMLETVSHAARVAMLVECLAVAATAMRPRVLRRRGDNGTLAASGLVPKNYIILHAGARHPINQWPEEKFVALAQALVVRGDFDVLLFRDTSLLEVTVPEKAIRRLLCMGPMDLDDFDALLSNARLVVANDSGPKHLAATRGVDTISLHIGRLSWNEWGQDGIGTILSKSVPCAGCALNDEAFCGQDVACLRTITVDEVLQVIAQRLEPTSVS